MASRRMPALLVLALSRQRVIAHLDKFLAYNLASGDLGRSCHLVADVGGTDRNSLLR